MNEITKKIIKKSKFRQVEYCKKRNLGRWNIARKNTVVYSPVQNKLISFCKIGTILLNRVQTILAA